MSKTDNRRWKGSDRPTEIAQGKGLNPGRCEAVEDAVVAEDVEKEPEEKQLGFLRKLMRE